MKIKGIPVWEQYLEYIILGVAALVFVGLLAMQFIGSPNAVKVGSTDVPPAEIDDVIGEVADDVWPRLSEGAPSPMEFPRPESAADSFTQQLTADVSPARDLLTSYVMPDVIEIGEAAGTKAKYIMPEVPTPTCVMAARTVDSIVPGEVEAIPELQEQFKAAPYDLTWVTAAAVFSRADLMQQYEDSSKTGVAIPPSWHGRKPYIVDVVVDRQEYVDGSWQNQVTIDPLPGRVSWRAELNKPQVDRRLGDYLRDQIDSQDSVQLGVVQPVFYATANDAWSAPEPCVVEEEIDLEGSDEENEITLKIAMLGKRLQKDEANLGRLQTQLEDLGGPIEAEDDNKPDRGSGGGRGGRSGGSSGTGAGAVGGGLPSRSEGTEEDPLDAERKKRMRRQLMAQIAKLERRVEKTRAELTELGVSIAAAEERDAEAVDPLEGDEITIWAHDITAEPGKTYRYRFTVKVLNPFFARKRHLEPDQQQFADALTLDSPASDWSERITVSPPVVYFVTRAEPASLAAGSDIGGAGWARVEVYRFFDSRWWQTEMRLEVGDPVVAADDDRFTMPWYVVDIAHDFSAPETRRPGQAAKIVLQTLDGSEVDVRFPDQDRSSSERLDLRDQVLQAEATAAATP